MPIDFTTTALIASIKTRSQMPSVQELFTDADICNVAGEVLRSLIVPEILKVNEDFFVTSVDQAITAGIRDYRMPSRTAYGRLRDVVGVDAAGVEYELSRYEPSDLKVRTFVSSGDPTGFYLEHDQVRLVPTPSSTNGHSVRFKYERRPGRLCLPVDAPVVTGFNTNTYVISCACPAAWAAGTIVDLIRPDGIFAYSSVDNTLVMVSAGTSITPTLLPTGIAVGQRVAEQGFSPIPQIPEEGHPWLAQETAVQLLGFHGDRKNYDTAKDISKLMKDQFLAMIPRRVADSPKRFASRNNPFTAR